MWSSIRFRVPNSVLASMDGPLEGLHRGGASDDDDHVCQTTLDSGDVVDREV